MRALRTVARVAVVAMTTATLAVIPGIAHADGTGLPIGLGSGSVGGLPAGVMSTGAGWDLATSGYSLADVDPISQTMSMGDLGTALTGDYALTQDLAATDMLAIDAAELARAARLSEEARRAALSAGAKGTGLKPGAVPAKYEGLVLAAVAEHCPQLRPALLAAQLEAESGWNPRAKSPVGAQGIAQFMKGTWAAYGVDGDNDGRADVYNPADAIPAAARYDCAVRDAVRKVPGDADANMLAGYNAGPARVISAGGVPAITETQNYVRTILTRAEELTDVDGGAGEAGTSAGCPTSAPAGTLRDAAATMSITTICADSVAAARTPEAARAIKFALRNLGVPYSQASRMSANAFDCSSFVMRAYAAAGADVITGGWAPNTYAIETVPWAKTIPFTSRQPGDLVYPFPGHITMALAHGLKVHTNRPGDVSHVNAMYTSAYLTVRIDTSQV